MGLCTSIVDCTSAEGASTKYNIHLKNLKNGSNTELRTTKKKNFKIILGSDMSLRLNVENFSKVNKSIRSGDVEFLKASLKDSFVFFCLSDTEFDQIISNMIYGHVPKNEYVFKQHDQSSCFFVIDSGTFDVEIDGAKKKSIRRGACFGELGLLYNAPRSASLKAAEDSYVWAIERAIFKKVIRGLNVAEYEENKLFMNQVSIFEGLTDFQKSNLASNVITQRFNPGTNIVCKNDKADSYYVIKSGIVECYDDEKLVRELQEGDSFGEQALYQDGLRSLTVKAKTEVRCLAISRTTLLTVFGSSIQDVLSRNNLVWILSNDSVFKRMSKLQIHRWINFSTIVKSQSEEFNVLERAGDKLKSIYIVIDGYMSYGKQLIRKGDIFGKHLVEKPELEDKALDHDLLVSYATYATIEKNKLLKLFKAKRLLDAIIINEQIHEKRKTASGVIAQTQNVIAFEDLIFVKKLGEGQFGTVCLVVNARSPTKELYALKSVSRVKINQFGIEKHIVSEKMVLEELNYKHVTRLVKTFKDAKAVHFLITYINGIEMFDMIRQVDLLENPECQFYIGSLILCLEHLHDKSIVYRDLKPENIMVDDKGCINLIDMGTAKKIEKNRTFTIIGTPHYMAPEVIQSKGYNIMADLWSLGVCMFEFMCGFVPFAEDEDDPFNVYKVVINGKLKFPPYFSKPCNLEARTMMNMLLNKVPEARLNGSYTELKTHKWFDDFDWVS